MKRNLFLIASSLGLITMCNAQIATNTQLTNTIWMYKNKEDNLIRFLEFTNDSIWESSYRSYNHRIIRYSKPYYLSNYKNEPFDLKKVGTSTAGKYLLRWNMTMKEKEYCEITTLTKDSLVLFFEAKPHYIGAADVYRTFKRVR